MLQQHTVAELLEVVVLVLLAYHQYIFGIVYQISFKVLQDYQLIVGRHKVVLTVVKLYTTACKSDTSVTNIHTPSAWHQLAMKKRVKRDMSLLNICFMFMVS